MEEIRKKAKDYKETEEQMRRQPEKPLRKKRKNKKSHYNQKIGYFMANPEEPKVELKEIKTEVNDENEIMDEKDEKTVELKENDDMNDKEVEDSSKKVEIDIWRMMMEAARNQKDVKENRKKGGGKRKAGDEKDDHDHSAENNGSVKIKMIPKKNKNFWEKWGLTSDEGEGNKNSSLTTFIKFNLDQVKSQGNRTNSQCIDRTAGSNTDAQI